MGSLGEDGDGEIKPGSENPTRPYPFDSQFLPTPLPGEKGEDAVELQILQSTMPLEETVRVEDPFDTQAVNLGGETQVLDDLDWFVKLDTQLIDDFDNQFGVDSDGEETDRTQVLDDGSLLSDDEFRRTGKCEFLDVENIQDTSLCEHGEKGLVEQPDDLIDEKHLSGSAPRFTSVRIKSLRAAGLAASCSASKETNNNDSCSLSTDDQISEHCTVNNNRSKPKAVEEVDLVTGRCDDEGKGFRNGKKCNIGGSTVRKLFAKNSFLETTGHSCNSDNTAEGKEVPVYDDGLAGLSYIDSQEPGDLSQANALACVQKLIEESKVLLDNNPEEGKSGRIKSRHFSAAKGAQSLAKKTTDRGINGKNGIFDWDDQCEDEGGGDIFCRRKEEFFGTKNLGQRSFIKPKKPDTNQLGGCRDNKGKLNLQTVIMVNSESKIVLRNLEANKKMRQGTEMNVSQNLVSEFDEQSKVDRSAGQWEAALTRKEVPEIPDIGFDTQMAAEAMEASHYDANDDQQKSSAKSGNQSSIPFQKCPEKVRKECDTDTVMTRSKRARSNAGLDELGRCLEAVSRGSAKSGKQSSISPEKHPESVRKKCYTDVVAIRSKRTRSDAKLDKFESHRTASKGYRSVKQRGLPERIAAFTPIAHRTRQSSIVSQLKSAEVSSDDREENECLVEVGGLEQNEAAKIDVEASKLLNAKANTSEMACSRPEEPGTSKSKLTALSNNISFPRKTRSRRNFSGLLGEPHNMDAKSKSSRQPINFEKSVSGHKRSQRNARITSTGSNLERKTRASLPVSPDSSPRYVDKPSLYSTAPNFSCADINGKMMSGNLIEIEAINFSDRTSNSPSTANKMNVPGSGDLLRDKMKSCESPCASPRICLTPVSAASPICMGSGYKQSCRKDPSKSCLMKELRSLCAMQPEHISEPKDLRKRRDLSSVRVLFSHHLDEDIIKQQQKIADRLKVSIASSILDATHFVTDTFVRTRNMLEAIAFGKPVITHLWLENIGRVKYYIDEQKYILRDAKKEKEFGFNLAASLALARQHPLLQGRRVLITPNTNPGKEIISSLVKGVHGQTVERVSRSTLKDDVVLDDLLILSCEEDYEVCLPFLEKGAAVYSSELLLNGIVIQKLEYERHRLFADHIKRTRSTIWMKKDGHNFVPVTKPT